jgi:hypothetical protein
MKRPADLPSAAKASGAFSIPQKRKSILNGV